MSLWTKIEILRSSVSVHFGVCSGSFEQSPWSQKSWWQAACWPCCVLVVFAPRFVLVLFLLKSCCRCCSCFKWYQKDMDVVCGQLRQWCLLNFTFRCYSFSGCGSSLGFGNEVTSNCLTRTMTTSSISPQSPSDWPVNQDIYPKWTFRCTRAHVHQFRLDMYINRPCLDFLRPPVNFLFQGTGGPPVFWAPPQCSAPWWSWSSPSSSPLPKSLPSLSPLSLPLPSPPSGR